MERVAADRTRTYFQIGSEETSALLMTWVGARELLYLSIKHGKPDFTRTEARELFAKCSPSFVLSIPELVGLVATAAEMEGRPDPKAGSSSGAGPTPGETPSSTDGDTPRESTSSA
jgi:hypothetical protein